LQKYNYINYTLIEIFKCLSRDESKIYCELFEAFEETIFYNILHTESDLLKIKNFIKKEISKLDINLLVKTRLLKSLSIMKVPNNKILKKKIDVDLNGYTIKINTMLT
jgi:U3 small nucleolar ribonucleoprotein component